MTPTKEQNAEVLRKLTKSNKIADFAMQVLHCDERRADAFTKVCGDFLRWDGTLQFKTASGAYVAADDPQCTGFFQREYDFLVPAAKVEGDAPVLDPDLIAKAKAGHMTARSQLFRELHKGKPKGTENETQVALDKILAGETPKGDDTRNRDAGGKFVANGGTPDASNPFSAAGWSVTEQGRVYKNDPARAARLAKAAGVTIGAVPPGEGGVNEQISNERSRRTGPVQADQTNQAGRRRSEPDRRL